MCVVVGAGTTHLGRVDSTLLGTGHGITDGGRIRAKSLDVDSVSTAQLLPHAVGCAGDVMVHGPPDLGRLVRGGDVGCVGVVPPLCLLDRSETGAGGVPLRVEPGLQLAGLLLSACDVSSAPLVVTIDGTYPTNAGNETQGKAVVIYAGPIDLHQVSGAAPAPAPATAVSRLTPTDGSTATAGQAFTVSGKFAAHRPVWVDANLIATYSTGLHNCGFGHRVQDHPDANSAIDSWVLLHA